MKTIKVGTRGSRLALAQTKQVTDALQALCPEVNIETVVIRSTGDAITDRPLREIGGSGLFTGALEDALRCGEVDFAVHSMKDLPAALAEGLTLAPPPKRADPRDTLIGRPGCASLADLPKGAKLGTGSPRRALQIHELRPDLELVPIRGNVDSRIAKVGGAVDGVVLAAAGLSRLGLTERISAYFSVDELLPAPCQGILALELREADRELYALLAQLGDADTAAAAQAERAFLRATGAGCHAPVGSYCTCAGDMLTLRGLFGADEQHYVRGSISGARDEAVQLGERLAERLLGELK